MTDYQAPPAPQSPSQYPAPGSPAPQGQGPAAPYGEYGYAPQPQVVVVEKKRNGLAVASMVLGIIALVFCWIPFLNFISYILAFVAIGLGIGGLVKASKHKVGLGMAIAGVVLSLGSVMAATVVNTATVEAIDESISEVTTDATEVNVTLGTPVTDEYGYTTVEVTVENVSEETQSPFVTVAAESADGATQYDTSTAYVNDLKPGQTATTEITFTEDIPSGAELVITDVI